MNIPPPKHVFIVITVHNRKALTRECLFSLRRQTIQCFKIIIVDDGSTDGTAEMIGNEFPDVVLLRGDGNLWWTGATNLGVEFSLAEASPSDYILTLNNDTVVRSDYLQTLLNSASEYPKSLIGSITVSDEDESIVIDAGVQINWLTAKYTNLAGTGSYNKLLSKGPSIHKVDVLPGRGTLIPVEVFRKVGLYDFKHLPHYGADYEFAHRANVKGYMLLINYTAVVISKVKATGLNNSVKSLKFGEFIRSFFSIRSATNLKYRWRYARLCCPTWKFPIFFTCDVIRVIIGSVLRQARLRPK